MPARLSADRWGVLVGLTLLINALLHLVSYESGWSRPCRAREFLGFGRQGRRLEGMPRRRRADSACHRAIGLDVATPGHLFSGA